MPMSQVEEEAKEVLKNVKIDSTIRYNNSKKWYEVQINVRIPKNPHNRTQAHPLVLSPNKVSYSSPILQDKWSKTSKDNDSLLITEYYKKYLDQKEMKKDISNITEDILHGVRNAVEFNVAHILEIPDPGIGKFSRNFGNYVIDSSLAYYCNYDTLHGVYETTFEALIECNDKGILANFIDFLTTRVKDGTFCDVKNMGFRTTIDNTYKTICKWTKIDSRDFHKADLKNVIAKHATLYGKALDDFASNIEERIQKTYER